MKYIVMECHGGYAVLLDEQAGFVKAVNAGYAVGDTVEDPKLIMAGKSRGAIIMKITKFAAAAAACLAVVLGIGYYNQYVDDYSYITISFDSDVKMSLNRQGEVLSVAGLNEEGELLIEGYDPDRKDKTTVSDELIDRAVEMGMITDGDTITFEIDTPDSSLSEEYGAELQNNAIEHTKKLKEVEVVIRKPEDASNKLTTAVTTQKQTAPATTSITAADSTSSVTTTSASAVTTTTITRLHNFHSAWDDERIDHPFWWDDDDDDSSGRDFDRDNDNDSDIDTDPVSGTDIGDTDIRDDHDNDDDTDSDAGGRDHHDIDVDSDIVYDEDGVMSYDTDSTDDTAEASENDIRGRHDDDDDEQHTDETEDTAVNEECTETEEETLIDSAEA